MVDLEAHLRDQDSTVLVEAEGRPCKAISKHPHSTTCHNKTMAMDHRTLDINLMSHLQLIHMLSPLTTRQALIRATVIRRRLQRNPAQGTILVATAQVMGTQLVAKAAMKMKDTAVAVLAGQETPATAAQSPRTEARRPPTTLTLSLPTTPTSNRSRSITITMAAGDLFDYTEYHLRLYGSHSNKVSGYIEANGCTTTIQCSLRCIRHVLVR